MNDEERITRLLQHATADVAPRSRRPTDDVLARAARTPWGRAGALGARMRQLLAGLLVVGAAGGGVYAVAANSGPDEPAPAPRPLVLEVDLPAGWTAGPAGTVLQCGTALEPRMVYVRASIDAALGCPDEPLTGGPAVVVGTLADDVREAVVAAGTATSIAGESAWGAGADTEVAVVAYALADSSAGVVVVGPRGEDDVPLAEALQGEDVSELPAVTEAVKAALRKEGDGVTGLRLPDQVAAVRLQSVGNGEQEAPGAQLSGEQAVTAVRAALAPAEGEACAAPVSARTLYAQDAASGRWVRVDVLEDATGCRSAVSELGGSVRIAGDPVAAALAAATGVSVPVPSEDEVARDGISVTVPAGWDAVRDGAFDPCTALRPAVVAVEPVPSCSEPRPRVGYAWLVPADAEVDVFGAPAVVPGAAGTQGQWTEALVSVDGTTVTGLLGSVPGAAGRVLLVGVPESAVAVLQRGLGLP